MPLLEVVQTRQISTTVDAAESPEREVHGVIHLKIHSQRLNGAAHRKKYDTPPLKGNCLDTFVSRCIPQKTDDGC
jgi:hypothetical protein